MKYLFQKDIKIAKFKTKSQSPDQIHCYNEIILEYIYQSFYMIKLSLSVEAGWINQPANQLASHPIQTIYLFFTRWYSIPHSVRYSGGNIFFIHFCFLMHKTQCKSSKQQSNLLYVCHMRFWIYALQCACSDLFCSEFLLFLYISILFCDVFSSIVIFEMKTFIQLCWMEKRDEMRVFWKI